MFSIVFRIIVGILLIIGGINMIKYPEENVSTIKDITLSLLSDSAYKKISQYIGKFFILGGILSIISVIG